MTSRTLRFLAVVFVVLLVVELVHLAATALGAASANTFDNVLHACSYGLSFVLSVTALVLVQARGGFPALTVALTAAVVAVPALYSVLLWFVQGTDRGAPSNWLLVPVLIPVAQVLTYGTIWACPWLHAGLALLLGMSLIRHSRRALFPQVLSLVGCLAACVWGRSVAEFILD
ncbi:hypothetical protein F0U59_16745 [Archangium gephyra]|nr:hypothetical protein F0U59_16745 [Archangium gephyra]